ncbi:hypothetical protein MMC29_006834, partial [Sticta canariensis]|nr:hypothetical protein [Sticta canariensis]
MCALFMLHTRLVIDAFPFDTLFQRRDIALLDQLKPEPIEPRDFNDCFKSGSLVSCDLILQWTDPVCTLLASRALSWRRESNAKLVNPTVVLSFDDGFPLVNVEGFATNLTFTLFDSEANATEPLMSKDACKSAINDLLVKCAGKHKDTSGGISNIRENSTVSYQ